MTRTVNIGGRLVGGPPLAGQSGKLVIGAAPQHDLGKRRFPQLFQQEGGREAAIMRHLGTA